MATSAVVESRPTSTWLLPRGSTEFRPSRWRYASVERSTDHERAVEMICMTWFSSSARVRA
ncbi:MAG: hypothetical protein LKE37_09920 [Atopobiaceae bacterium]|nr:hypothetical protein [Atopobiaceae bacterium]